jgi:hypothetical protein
MGWLLDGGCGVGQWVGVLAFFKSPAFIIIGAQLLFSASDLMGRWAMKTQGF